MNAIGTIITTQPREPFSNEIHTLLLDYYDHWSEIDSRLSNHHQVLSRAAELFAHDLVNMATYAQEILNWLEPDRMYDGNGVLVAGGMTEAYLLSARCACDSIALALAYVVTKNKGRAPSTSLRKLFQWLKKHPQSISEENMHILEWNLDWFWKLRTFRDLIVHDGTTVNMHTDRHQFNLWLYHHKLGWITREPLLPFLGTVFNNIMELANKAGMAVNTAVPLPADRFKTRMVNGIRIGALNELVRRAPDYARPSP